jgi:endonuclease YncB( thermonuclease family)
MRVDLLSIDAGTNKKDAKSFLEKNVLNFEAELIYSPERFSQKDVSGIILIDKKSINRLMLEQGIAGYKRSKLYEIAHFYDCVHRKSEEKAKQKKLGIWADNAARR